MLWIFGFRLTSGGRERLGFAVGRGRERRGRKGKGKGKGKAEEGDGCQRGSERGSGMGMFWG